MSLKINVVCPECSFSNETFFEFVNTYKQLYCMNCSNVFKVQVENPDDLDFTKYDNRVSIDDYNKL